MSKKIEVNSSSIVDLKAELFRKQEEVRQKKNFNDSNQTLKASSNSNDFVSETSDDRLYDKSEHNISRLSGKILGSVAPRNEKRFYKKDKDTKSESKPTEMDLAKKHEEELALSKSREMLEKKAKLYEQMASGSVIPDVDNEELLVDFDQKSMIAHKHATSYEDDDQCEEELVEYLDEFGRTRLVNRKDLPQESNDHMHGSSQQQWTLA